MFITTVTDTVLALARVEDTSTDRVGKDKEPLRESDPMVNRNKEPLPSQMGRVGTS